jgi:NADH dehydrogenase
MPRMVNHMRVIHKHPPGRAGARRGAGPDYAETVGRPGIVIIGGGFGGLACARRLDGSGLDVLLIDSHNYHLFTPLLYQVATALLNPSDIAYPLRRVFRRSRNVRFRQGAVESVDVGSRIVRMYDGDEIPYAACVVATGSVNDYFGHGQLARDTIGLRYLDEALRLRQHVLSCLERASQEPDPAERRRWLTFVVAGGGPTGVEYAGALAELLQIVLGRDYPELRHDDARIVVVEGRERVLPSFPARLGRYAERQLHRRRVEVQTGTLVARTSEADATLSSGEAIPTRTIVWSAGVRPVDPLPADGIQRSRSRRVDVDARLRVVGATGLYAIGDAAAAPGPEGELPMVSPPAMQEGRYVAGLLRRGAAADPARVDREPAFRYLDKGSMATIGRNAAVASIGPLRLTGFVGWVTWLVVHLYYLIGFRNRLIVLIEWGWAYLRRDRPIRMITPYAVDPLATFGEPPPAVEEPGRPSATA